MSQILDANDKRRNRTNNETTEQSEENQVIKVDETGTSGETVKSTTMTI